jgi:hypothetical protein
MSLLTQGWHVKTLLLAHEVLCCRASGIACIIRRLRFTGSQPSLPAAMSAV